MELDRSINGHGIVRLNAVIHSGSNIGNDPEYVKVTAVVDETTPATGHPEKARFSVRSKLRDSGLRVTPQRLAVLNWLADHPHASADEVRSGVQTQLGSVSVQAIYDVLAACTTAGLVRRIHPAGHAARFECRVNDNHHHAVCRHCGRIADVDCLSGTRPCLTPDADHGFAIDEAEVVFWGVCPRCRTRAAPEHVSMPSARTEPQL